MKKIIAFIPVIFLYFNIIGQDIDLNESFYQTQNYINELERIELLRQQNEILSQKNNSPAVSNYYVDCDNCYPTSVINAYIREKVNIESALSDSIFILNTRINMLNCLIKQADSISPGWDKSVNWSKIAAELKKAQPTD